MCTFHTNPKIIFNLCLSRQLLDFTVFVKLTNKENIIKSLRVYIAVILLFSVLAVQLTPAPKPSQ